MNNLIFKGTLGQIFYAIPLQQIFLFLPSYQRPVFLSLKHHPGGGVEGNHH